MSKFLVITFLGKIWVALNFLQDLGNVTKKIFAPKLFFTQTRLYHNKVRQKCTTISMECQFEFNQKILYKVLKSKKQNNTYTKNAGLLSEKKNIKVRSKTMQLASKIIFFVKCLSTVT